MQPSDLATYAAAFSVGTVATARVCKLIVEDDYPPMAWIRAQWDKRTQRSDWNDLMHCCFCMGVWVALANVGAAFASHLHTAWWFVNLWLATAYVVGMIVVRDLPIDQRK